MNFSFFRTFGWIEIGLLGLFVLIYVLFMARTFALAKAVRTNGDSVFFKLILRAAYFALMLVALLGPVSGETTQEVRAVGRDVFLLVDLSKSMDANDVQPNRLEKTKFELTKLLERIPGDRVGLIIFTTGAFMQCPLTYDHSAVQLFIETLNTDLISSSGTDFVPPLKMAIEKLMADTDKDGKSQSKVVVLLSDGEHFGDDLQPMIDELNKQKIPVFAVGVGTSAGGKIPQGFRFKKDQQGNEVVSNLNATSLKNIASQTDGRYFELNDDQNDMQRLANAINSIEGQLRDSRMIDVAANRYSLFLLIAFALLLLDVLTSVKIIRL